MWMGGNKGSQSGQGVTESRWLPMAHRVMLLTRQRGGKRMVRSCPEITKEVEADGTVIPPNYKFK